MIKVSIIVPVYNVEMYIERCIDSLVNQSLDEIEIILVNDASPDNSLNIIKEYKIIYPNKIIIIDSKENLKQGGAKNLGLKAAKGEYVGFVDSDDWVKLDMFEKLYNNAKEFNSDIVDSDLYIASDEENIINVEISNYKDQLGYLDTDKKRSLILHSGRMVTKIFKRELFLNNHIIFSEKLFYEDNEIIPLLMVKASKLTKVDEPLYYYFKKNISSTTSKINSYHHFDRLITAKKMKDSFEYRGLLKIYNEEIEYRFIELYYLNTIHLCLTKFNVPEITYLIKIRKYIKDEFPNYRKNKYFNAKTSFRKRTLSKLNDINPRLLTIVFSLGTTFIPRNTLKKIGRKLDFKIGL